MLRFPRDAALQARTSYRSFDIKWGYSFEPMVSLSQQESSNRRVAVVHFDKLHQLRPGILKEEDDPRLQKATMR